MTELDEVAASIYEKHKESWPITRREAQALVFLYLREETKQLQDNVVDALMELNNEQP